MVLGYVRTGNSAFPRRRRLVVPPTASATGGGAPQVLVAFPVVFGAGSLVAPKRVLLLHRFLGLSTTSDGEVDVHLWRLRGATFVAVGVFVP